MTRRRTVQPVDHAANRPQWRDLVEAVHTTVALPTQGSLDRLAGLALKAKAMWVLPAAYPRGLQANILWSVALAFARQPDPASRERLSPLLLAAAGMVDELLAEAGVLAAPALAAPALAAPTERAGRLPYADA